MGDTIHYKGEIPYTKMHQGEWTEAIPIGNGRLGAMVFGGVNREYLQLNEDTVWYKGKMDRINKDAHNYMGEIQDLILAGELERAEELIGLAVNGTPVTQGHYEPLANVYIDFIHEHKETTDYARRLDLSNAVATVVYKKDTALHKRNYFASAVDQVIVVKIESTISDINVNIGMNRDKNFDEVAVLGENMLGLRARCGGINGVTLSCVTGATSDGEIKNIGDHIVIRNAIYIEIYISGQTTYNQDNPEDWNKKKVQDAIMKGYKSIKDDHQSEYEEMYNRVQFKLGPENAVHTIEKLESFKTDNPDYTLIPLYYQFSRYLLISSSRPGSQAANLQGIWNKEYNPAWDSKYTININTEMNYWLSNTGNLSECELPLFDLLHKMLPNGKKVAKEIYGIDGFVAHHNTDIWGDCAPQGAYITSSMWPMGAAWLSTHIYNHYEYTQDITVLEDNYILLKEATKFISSFLRENKEGELVTVPTLSPENTYLDKYGVPRTICVGPTSDMQITHLLFEQFIKASELLSTDEKLRDKVKEQMMKLPKHKISKYDTLQEWTEDYEEVEPGHRHSSHMFAVYPGEQITIQKTPEFAKAASRTIDRRLEYGNIDGLGFLTGWAHAWRIAIHARLQEPEKALQNLEILLEKYTAKNLFCLHPPFQIDGNFGAAAGIIEMLVQSHSDFIQFLPSLPEKWQEGMLKGIKLKPGLTVDFEWEQNKMKQATIISNKNQVIKICNKQSFSVTDTAGKEVALIVQASLKGTLGFYVKEDLEYRIKFD